MNRATKLFFLILLAAQFTVEAQQEDVYVKFKEKFPDESAVIVERSEVMTVQVDGDSLRIFSDNFEDILHLKEHSEGMANKRVYGSHFNKVENLRAKTLLWDKNRYKEMLVSDFKRTSDQADGIFFDDSYYYSFNFPSIALRNRTQLEYRDVLGDPHFMSGFIFSSYLPQGKASFIIKTTKDVELEYKILNDPAGSIKFRRTEKGNSIILEWTALNLPGLRSEERSPAIRYFAPHVICYVKSFTTKKGRTVVLNHLDDLYKWYATFVRDVDPQASPELSAIVKSIKTSSKNELDFVKQAFYWVQNNIQYIAFEQGMRGFIPHSGSYVCEKRYGDCKDMANLIVTMLRTGGVEAYHTWIGSRDLPYKYSDMPTPLVDNHMIATYITKDGNYYFLDATSDHTPFGFPSSMIQGKQALIGLSPSKYEIRTVPIVEMNRNVMMDSMKVTLRDNQLIGTGQSSLHGFAKVFGGYEMDRAEKDDVKRYVTRLLGKGNNKFYLDSYSILNLENHDRPTRIDYGFRIGDYHQIIGDEIYLNLNLNKEYYNAFINLDVRKTPYENEYPYVKHEDIEFTIPEGFTLEYLPENFSLEEPPFGCVIKYKSEKNKVIFSKKFYLNYLMLGTEDFSRWNDAVKKFSEAYKESIILKKK